jgi:hypothetical protein
VTEATRRSDCAAFILVLATSILGSFMVGLMPAMAVDLYGCRGDQACVKTAEATRCDSACQRACKEYRYDYATCFTVWGPKFEFLRNQQSAEKRGTK